MVYLLLRNPPSRKEKLHSFFLPAHLPIFPPTLPSCPPCLPFFVSTKQACLQSKVPPPSPQLVGIHARRSAL
jgi:hypothetical protein